jgi:hypothetical protein
LAARLDDSDADVRDVSADALNEMAAERPTTLTDHVDELVAALRTTGGETLTTVVHRLAEFNVESIGAALGVDAENESVGAVHDAIEAAPRDGIPDSSSDPIPDWLSTLAETHAPERVRDREEDLVAALDADDARQRNLAARALSGAADTTAEAVSPTLPAIVDSLATEDDATVRYNLALAIRQVAATIPEAAQPVLGTLIDRLAEDPDADVRRVAALALSDIADEVPAILADQPLSQLAAGARADEAQIREYTARILDSIAVATPEAIAETVPALADLLDDPGEKTRNLATRALVRVTRQEPHVVRDAASTMAERLGGTEGLDALCGRVAFETLRGDTESPVGDRNSNTCDFLYFGATDMWGCPHEPASDGRCLFHQPVTETDDEAVREAFVEAVTNEGRYTKEFFGATFGDLDMSHTVVDAGDNYPIELKGAAFEGRVDWSEATVDHEIYLEDARFEGPVDCSQGVFERRVSAQRTTFADDVDFTRAAFGESGHFDAAMFESDASFGQAQFALDAVFTDVSIAGEGNFFGGSVGQYARFDDLRIEGDANFKSVSFEGPQAVFTDSDFSGEATFYKATFEGTARFNDSTFGSVSFHRTTFADIALFRELSVSGTLDATHSEFTDQLYGREMAVDGSLDFTSATIAGDAILVETACDGDVIFENAVFDGKLNLQETVVGGALNLERATVHGGAVLICATVDGSVALDNARFAGRCNLAKAELDGGVSADRVTVDGLLSFERATVSDTVTAENADVGGQTTFDGAEVGGVVELTNVVFDGSVTFTQTIFTSDVTFDGSVFRSAVDFSSVEADIASFADCTFAVATFQEIDAETLSFADATVETNLDLEAAAVTAALSLSGAAVNGCCDLSKATLPSGGDFEDATIGALRAKRTAAGDTLGFVGTIIEEGTFFEVDLPPSAGRIDFARGELQSGRIIFRDTPAVFDFTDSTIGNVLIEGGEDCFDYLRLVQTSFEGFEFSRHKDELETAGWKLHGLVEDAAVPEQDYDPQEVPDGGTKSSREAVTAADLKHASTDGPDRHRSVDDLLPGRLENTYLKAKNGANDIGDNSAAAEFFLREMYYRRVKYTRLLRATPLSRSSPRLASKWIGNMLLNVSCGYGERPFRTVGIAGIISITFAVLYWALGIEVPYSGGIGYLTFSLDSFVSLVLGPPETTDSLTTFLVALESFLGGFVIALFVFALTRSVNR